MRSRFPLALAVILIGVGIVIPTVFGAPQEDLHVNIQTTDDSGDITTGTFNFTFNISASSDCSSPVYSNATTLPTDSRGVISYYLEDVSINYAQQYWLCYYRDGVLKSASQIARVPYSFLASNLSCVGCVNATMLEESYLLTSGGTLTGPLTVLGLVSSTDWTNVTITEAQISNLAHTNDTNVTTACSGDQVLLGNGTCSSSAGFYDDTDTNTQKNASGPYLYNDTTTIHFNETYLNATIDARDTVGGGNPFDQSLNTTDNVSFPLINDPNSNSFTYWGSGGELIVHLER